MRIGTRVRRDRPAQGDGSPDQTTAPERDGEPRTRQRAVAGWVVAVVAGVVAAVALALWLPLASRADDRAEAARVAGSVFSALTNWDAGSLEGVEAQVAELATDRFREEARALIGDLGQGLAQADARSTGEVLDLAVELHEGAEGGRTAAALALVRQEILNAGLDAPRADCWGARAVLRHVDGRWLVDALELYGPNACPQEGTSP